MTTPSVSGDLGPLPQGDRQDTLQQLSIQALQAFLPVDKFLFRNERVDDKGVDGSLEAKATVQIPKPGGAPDLKIVFTNCRAQAQLKSTDSTERNQDGTLSVSIETSNLNYLLNGQCPIYLLWISATGEFRYAWAHDEWRRLDAENPNWKSQGTFTVRFGNVLTHQAIGEIHERIIREAQFERSIHEALARSSLSERVVVSIDPKTLESTDPHQLHEWLTASGMTIVSAGYGRQVVDWVAVLNPQDRQEARIQLVAAYAQSSLGRYCEALGHLSAAGLRRTDLPPLDQHFLAHLRNVCQYQTGQISLEEYLCRDKGWVQGLTGAAAAQYKLDEVLQRRLRERDAVRRAEMLAEMRSHASAIQAADDATPAMKLQARILMISAAGEELGSQFTENLAFLQARHNMRYPVDENITEIASTTKHRWKEWDDTAVAVIKEAVDLGNPILVAHAMTARLSVHQGLSHFQRMEAIGSGRKWEPQAAIVYTLMRDAEQAMKVYQQAGSREGEVRAKLLLADLFDTVDHPQAARSIAEGALIDAQAMNYVELESWALEYIEGNTTIRQFEARVAERAAQDEDALMAVETDERLRDLARFTLEAAGLPAERLPFVERYWVSERAISRERLNWCRHILLLQNLTHERRPETHYRCDPPRICKCDKHQYESAIESPEWEGVIEAFKRSRCAGCVDQDPKIRV
jgi:hypothetical protein